MQNDLEVMQALTNGYTLRDKSKPEYKVFLDENRNLAVQGPFGFAQNTLYSLKHERWEVDDTQPVREFFS